MADQSTVDALLERLATLEERTAHAEQRAAALEARLSPSHDGGPPSPNGKEKVVSRGRFMKAAGMGLAGLAGAALLEKEGTKDAYATSFTDVVTAQAYIASGTTGTPGSPAGYGLNAPASANFDRGVDGNGVNHGVFGHASGASGVAVKGLGSGTSSIGGYFSGGLGELYLLTHSGTDGPPPGLTDGNMEGYVFFDNFDTLWVGTNWQGWYPVQRGGLGQSLFTAVSTRQYLLPNSDGITWVDMDATNLALTISPKFDCQAVITINVDLWTTVAGHNQDVAAFISGGSFGAGKVVGWKESGSISGAFSPNAAYLETIQTLAAASTLDPDQTYTIKVQWKANNNATGATIVAGAGPIPVGTTTFSPTRLTVWLVPDQHGVNAPTSGPTKQVLGLQSRR